MAFREDWTRITASIHTIISAFRHSPEGGSGNTRKNIGSLPHPQRTPFWVRNTMNARFLAEIERRRSPAYMSSLRNQIR